MVSLGCSKNQVDAERILATLRREGFELSGDVLLCDVVIVNTCGFIEDAKKESIGHILEFGARKDQGGLKALVVTGCLAERYRDELADEMPEVDVVLGIGKNADIASAIRAALGGERVVEFGEKSHLSLEGERVLFDSPHTAYLKIADGCGNRCSYCAIPIIRGDFRSRRIEDVLSEANSLAESGVTELNLIAQDTTRYGEDIYGELMLPKLLEKLCEIDSIHWIRVLYCYPQRVTDKLLKTMAKNAKIVPYIDLPIQHVSKRVLSEMGRQGDSTWLRKLIVDIRKNIPEVAIRTTLITGFPGETEEEFAELCEFVRDMRFERLGCFVFSPEEGTPAALMKNQIDDEVKRRRADIIMELQMDIALENGNAMIGKTIQILCEGFDKKEGMWFGRSSADAPDVDTKVYFYAENEVVPGDYITVKITEGYGYDILGIKLEV